MPKKKIPEVVDLKIDWNVPEDVITRFATNLVTQTIDNEFKLTFFEIKPEIVFDEEEQQMKMIEKGTVRADCISSIIVTADRMPRFLKVLNEQLIKYQDKQKKTSTKK